MSPAQSSFSSSVVKSLSEYFCDHKVVGGVDLIALSVYQTPTVSLNGAIATAEEALDGPRVRPHQRSDYERIQHPEHGTRHYLWI